MNEEHIKLCEKHGITLSEIVANERDSYIRLVERLNMALVKSEFERTTLAFRIHELEDALERQVWI